MFSSANRIVLACAGAALAAAVRLRSEPAPPSLRRWSGSFSTFARVEPQPIKWDLYRSVDVERLDGSLEAQQYPEIPDDVKEDDMKIYKSHWEPLEPPPYHHPEYCPEAWEFKELEVLEQNYTNYWRSLPRYTKVSKSLKRAQDTDYIKWRNWTNFTWHIPCISNVTENLVFVIHHKTGVTIRHNIQLALPPEKFSIAEWHEPVLEVPQEWPEHMKTVHFMRDPVDTIASAYRYHMNRWGSETWSWGHYALQDPQCFSCDDKDHEAIFDTCNFNCTYFELLNRVDEMDGIVLEAVSSRNTLTTMSSFMAFKANRSDTLHLSMDLFKKDLDKTTRCLLNFLGVGNNATLQANVAKAAAQVDDSYHVTSGRYNNTKIRAFLENHPKWSADFREIRELMSSIYRRQAVEWGCPDSE